MDYIVNKGKCLSFGSETFNEGDIIKEEIAKKISIESLLKDGAISEYEEPEKQEPEKKEPEKQETEINEPEKQEPEKKEPEKPKFKNRFGKSEASDI
jgi:hypothetical protein